MKFTKKNAIFSFFIVIATLGVFDLCIAKSNYCRYWVQNKIWSAPNGIKALLQEELGKPYTVLGNKYIDEPSMTDELKMLKFWVEFEFGEEFIAVPQSPLSTNSIIFVSLKSTLGSYYRNLLKYTSPIIKDVCLYGMPSRQITIDEDGLKESFLIIDGVYTFSDSELKSTKHNLIQGKCEYE